MSGVVDKYNQQWEHCCICRKFVRFPQDLGYIKPDIEYKYGRDVCVICVDNLIRSEDIRFDQVFPAPSWQITNTY